MTYMANREKPVAISTWNTHISSTSTRAMPPLVLSFRHIKLQWAFFKIILYCL